LYSIIINSISNDEETLTPKTKHKFNTNLTQI